MILLPLFHLFISLGAAKNWPAYRLWTDEYMKKKYGNYTVRMETKDDDKFNIPPAENFAEFLDKYQDNSSRLYLVDEVYPEMRKEIVLPLCLRCEEIDRFFFVSFLWYSGGGTMSTVHIDTDENLLCVLKGHKKVCLSYHCLCNVLLNIFHVHEEEPKLKGN